MIELRMLGRLSLTLGDGQEARSLLGQPRRLALLAYLAAPPPGMHRRDTLLAVFWPELDQARARNALRQAIHVLRGTLGPSAVTSHGDEAVGLDFDQVWCDVGAFDGAIARGHRHEALDLYRGGLLEGFFISDAPEFERWLEAERSRLREAAAGAARHLAEQEEARGNLTTAVHWAHRAARLAPSDEAALRRLIALLDRHGDRVGALEAYEEFATRLAADYEAKPAPETQALVAAVRARDRAMLVQLPPIDLLSRLRAGLGERYRVERELARGRTATVFLAQDVKHGRPVAIKVLHPELAAAVGPARFLREIQLAAQLQHPHIVALHDSGETDGLLYFVMPYVTGESLRNRLDREAQLPIAEAVRIASDVAQALGYAHTLGVVHRDIKPENVLLADGHALVADFGIARAISAAGSERLTETGIALGTPAYMSPEQGAQDGHVDGRSDLYALGCVVYEMLAGAPPFTGPTAQAILARHAVDPVAPIRTVRETVPPALERAVLKTLAKVPADRYSTTTEFADALAAPSVAPERRAWLRTPGATLTRRAAVLSVALVALVSGLKVVWERLVARASGHWVHSVAVLPLENLSGDTTQDPFADGMTAALITDLGRIGALRVVSHQSVIPFRRTTLSARALGESLHVDALVEGGIQRSGERFRADLQLIDVASGNQLWAQRFENKVENRFGVQDSISRGVAGALKLTLSPTEERVLGTPPTSNAQAYEFYLRGKVRVRRENPEDDSAAIILFERATALDPSFAAAQAELARAYALRAYQFVREDTTALEHAQVAAERALRLDPNLAEAHQAQAVLLWGTPSFAHERAIQEDQRALSLNPNLDRSHQHLGNIYLHIGLLDEAIEEFRKTLAISPLDDNAQRRMAEARGYQGRYQEALEMLKQANPETNPSLWHFEMAWLLLHLGRNDDALALIQAYLKAHPEDRGGVVTSARAVWFALQGDAPHAEQDIETAIDKGKGYIHFHHAGYHIALAYALLHQPDSAVQWLRRIADGGFPCYPLFERDPFLDNIRADPRFTAFLGEQREQWERFRATL